MTAISAATDHLCHAAPLQNKFPLRQKGAAAAAAISSPTRPSQKKQQKKRWVGWFIVVAPRIVCDPALVRPCCLADLWVLEASAQIISLLFSFVLFLRGNLYWGSDVSSWLVLALCSRKVSLWSLYIVSNSVWVLSWFSGLKWLGNSNLTAGVYERVNRQVFLFTLQLTGTVSSTVAI